MPDACDPAPVGAQQDDEAPAWARSPLAPHVPGWLRDRARDLRTAATKAEKAYPKSPALSTLMGLVATAYRDAAAVLDEHRSRIDAGLAAHGRTTEGTER